MKTILCYALTALVTATMFAQNDSKVSTQTIKIENFITYAAEQKPSETAHIIFLAVETGSSGLETEELFYIEQGLRLLSKRLPENSFISIGTYGAIGKIVIPYTQIDKLNDHKSLLNQSKTKNSNEPQDGIDLAFQMASSHYNEEAINKVVLIRNGLTKVNTVVSNDNNTSAKENKNKPIATSNQKLGGALALTALSILPEVLDIIKD